MCRSLLLFSVCYFSSCAAARPTSDESPPIAASQEPSVGPEPVPNRSEPARATAPRLQAPAVEPPGEVSADTEAPEAVNVPLPRFSSSDRGGPGRPGAVSSVGPRTPRTRRFRITLEGEVRSSPAAWDQGLVIATRDGRLMALDPATGSVRWQVPTQAIRGSAPAIADGTVYVAEISRRGLLHAVELASGSRRWSKEVGPTSSSVAVVHGTVLVTSDQLGGIAALNAEDGEVRWRTPLPGWKGSPAAGDDRVLVGTKQGVTALAIDDGHELWSALLGGPAKSPAILGEYVAVALEEGGIAVLRLRDGALCWRSEVPEGPVGLPAIDGQRVYLAGGHELVAFDLNDGHLRWRAPAAPGTSPSVADDILYILTADNRIAALDAASGEVRWQLTLERPVGTLPVVARGAIILPLRVDPDGLALLVAFEDPGSVGRPTPP